MLACSECGSFDVKTTSYNRYIDAKNVYVRGRICNNCNYEFKTAELDYNRYQKAADLNNMFVQLIRQVME